MVATPVECLKRSGEGGCDAWQLAANVCQGSLVLLLWVVLLFLSGAPWGRQSGKHTVTMACILAALDAVIRLQAGPEPSPVSALLHFPADPTAAAAAPAAAGAAPGAAGAAGADGGDLDMDFSAAIAAISAVAGDWTCLGCTLRNAASSTTCGACGFARGGWSCPQCTFSNPSSSTSCSVCGRANPTSTAGATASGATGAWSGRTVFWFLRDVLGADVELAVCRRGVAWQVRAAALTRRDRQPMALRCPPARPCGSCRPRHSPSSRLTS